MGALILPRRLQQQPQSIVAIDKGHPLARGLVFLSVPIAGGFYDYVSGQTATHSGTTRARLPVDGNRAAAVSAIGSNSAGGTFANQTGLDRIAGPFSLFVEGSLEVNASTQELLTSRESGAGNGMTIKFDDVSAVNNGVQYYANNGDRANSAFNVLGASSEQFTHRVLLTVDGTNARFYTKRILQTTAATAVLPTANSARRTTMCGFQGNEKQGSIAVGMGWDRVLTLAEYQMLHDNPWQLLIVPQRLFAGFDVGGSPDVSVALTGQAITSGIGALGPNLDKGITGQAVTTGQGTISPSGDVTVALTGQQITSGIGTLSPGSSKAITGFGITSGQGSFAPDSSLPITGQAITAQQGSLIYVGDVTIALTGQEISVQQGLLSIEGQTRLGGFEMVDMEPTWKRALRLRAEAKHKVELARKSRKRAEMLEKVAAKVAMSDNSAKQVEYKLNSLFREWIELSPTLDMKPANEIPQVDAYAAFMERVAQYAKKLQEDDDESAILLLLM